MTNTSSLLYIGLAVTSHDTSSLCVAVFDNLAVPGWTNSVAPSAPASLAASAGNAQAVLSWAASSGATGYNVKRSTNNGGPYTTIASGINATNYTDSGLTNGALYYYVVSSVNATGESANSPQASVASLIIAPLGVAATAASTNQINVAWIAFSSASSYNVKRSTASGGPYATVAGGVAATSYVDSGLSSGALYYYVVSAVVNGVETPNSAPAAGVTLSKPADGLIHRYSFAETSGTNIADSIGGPAWAGTLPNGGTLSGRIILASASSQYASLPPGIAANAANCSILAWFSAAATNAGSRLFDFGSGTSSYMYLAAQGGTGAGGALRFGITTAGSAAEQQIACSHTIAAGTWHMAAVVLTPGVGILYLDGYPAGTNSSLTLTPASLGATPNNYLGKSQNADSYFDGSVNEFRVYNAALSAQEITAARTLGRSQLLSAASPQMSAAFDGANLTLAWPLASAGFTLQSRTNLSEGAWMDETEAQPQAADGLWQLSLPLSSDSPPLFYRIRK